MKNNPSQKGEVLIAIPMLLTGGTEVQTLYLATSLINLGYRVTLCCYFEYEQSVVEQFQSLGVCVNLLGLSRSTRQFHLMAILRKYAVGKCYEYAHIQYVQPGLIPVIAFRLARINNLIINIHQPSDYCSFKSKVFFKVALLLSQKCISVSKYVQTSWGMKNSSKCKVIYNCVSTDWIQYPQKHISKTNKGALNIAIVGRLRHEKGQSIALDAMRLLKSYSPLIKLSIIGDGIDSNYLFDKAKSLSLESVDFQGIKSKSEIIEIYREIDLLIIPSKFEGFGLVAIEAMSSGIPVVASRVGGLPEVVSEGETGLLYEAGSVEELARCIRYFFDNPECINQFGFKGREKVKSVFSFENYSENIMDIYDAR